MRKRWYVLAVAAGGLAAAVVWLWPVSPLWRSEANSGRLEGFSPDGRVLVTSWLPHAADKSGWPDPVVSRYDVATGKLLARTALRCAHPTRLRAVRPSPDGRLALVGEGFSPDPTSADFARGDWYLHDAITGERLTGPIADVAFVVPFGGFSADGRWFAGRRDDPKPWSGQLGIYSAREGKLLVDLTDRNERKAGACTFAPDGETVAVQWLPADAKAANSRQALQIVELPSGKERRWIDLPKGSWVSFQYCDPRRLQAKLVEHDVATDRRVWRWFTFDLSQEVVEGVEEPLLRTTSDKGHPSFCLAGESWVAYFTFIAHPSGQQKGGPGWWERFLIWPGPRQSWSRGPYITARLADRTTGEVRYEISQPLGHPCFMTPDGRRLACAAADEAVEVWDTNPLPRWPVALTTGTALALGVLCFGCWHARRQTPVRPDASATISSV